VTVSVGGQPAYLNFVSPGQINLIVPPVANGSTQITVMNEGGSSATHTVNTTTYSPAFFPWPANQIVATRQDFTLVAKPGTFPGATTVAAKPGEVLILWGTGFGPTTPAAPSGAQTPADRTYSTTVTPFVIINNLAVTVYGAALAPGFAGLYQIAIQVPPTLGDGDWSIRAQIGGVMSPTGTVLSVRR
jgi:uncharacterized protein (TIGR03437 family)